MSPYTYRRLLVFFALSVLPAFAQTASLSINNKTGSPGDEVTLNVRLGGGAGPAAVDWRLNYPTGDLSLVSVSTGGAASGAGKTATCTGSAGSETCIVIGLGNNNPIGNGTVARLRFAISSGTDSTSASVSPVSASASSPDGTGISVTTSSGTVTIEQANGAPEAEGQSVTTDEDESIGITLSGSDPDGDELTFSLVSEPAHGDITGNAPNLTYHPSDDFHGSDSFTFKVEDTHDASDTAEVSITVESVNDKPEAIPQSVETEEGASIGITLDGEDADGDSLSFSVTENPSHGTLSGAPPLVTYTPDEGFHGNDSFVFKVDDSHGGTDTAEVSVGVEAVNGDPEAAPQSVSTDEDESISITLEGSDPDDDELTFSLVSGPQHGSLSGDLPNVTYMPDTNYHGSDSFRFRVRDPSEASDTATVSITVDPVNDKPEALSQSVGTESGNPVGITLEGEDADEDNLAFSIVEGPSHGVLSGTPPNVTYTPSEDFEGEDHFVFKVDDSHGGVDTAEVAINVVRENQAPEAEIQSVTTQEDESISITLEGSDPDGEELTFSLVSEPEHGSLSGNLPNVTYVPDQNFHGSDSFRFRVRDPHQATDTAEVSISVEPVNDKPEAIPQSVVSQSGSPVEITLAGEDADEDALSFSIVEGPAHGVLSGTPPHLTYTPDQDFEGEDGFVFEVSDSHGGTDTAEVAIDVGGENAEPTAEDQSVATEEDEPLSISLNGSDPDDDPLTFSLVSEPEHGSLSGDLPNVSYTPNENFHGSDSFRFKVSDPHGASDTAAVSVSVESVNDKPEALPRTVGTKPGTPVEIELRGEDADGDELSFSIVGQPSHGSLSGAAPNVTYTPGEGFEGEDGFVFEVKDPSGLTDQAEVIVTVSEDQEQPLLSSVVCSPGTIVGKGSTSCTVSLIGGQKAAGSLTISVESSQLQAPSAVEVPSGATQATFEIVASDITTEEVSVIRVSAEGSETVSTELHLLPFAPVSLSCDQPVIAAGSTLACQAGLNSGDFEGSLALEVTSSSAQVLAPSMLTVAGGQTTSSFEISALEEAEQHEVEIRVSRAGAYASTVVLVIPNDRPVLLLSKKHTVFQGESLEFTVEAVEPQGLPVTISALNLPPTATFSAETGVFAWDTDETTKGEFSVTFTAVNSLDQAATEDVTIFVFDDSIEIGAAVNAASYSQDFSCSPNALVTLFGTGFGFGPPEWASRFPLPTELHHIKVLVNDEPTPLLYADDTQINLQCPTMPPGQDFEFAVEHAAPDKAVSRSEAVSLPMHVASPGLFSVDGSGKGQGIVVIANTELLAARPNAEQSGRPARPKEHVTIYATGLGDVESPPAPGMPASEETLSTVINEVRVKVGDIYVEVTYAGLAPGFVGLYQINALLPSFAPLGFEVPILVEVVLPDGSVLSSNTLTIAIQP